MAAHGCGEKLNRALSNQTDPIHFPVSAEIMRGLLPVKELASDRSLVGAFRVSVVALNHPGGCKGFRIEADGASVAYLPDHEPFGKGGAEDDRTQEIIDFVRGVDLLILDTQYTDVEYPKRIGWGHGCLSNSIGLAVAADVREIALFHLDPSHTDEEVDQMVECGRYLARSADLLVRGAAEDEEIVLGLTHLQSKSTGGHEACIGLALLGDETAAPTPMNMDQSPSDKAPESSAMIASELNNLLQIIAGTSALIENIWEGNEGADKYFGMLRESVARAAEVTTDLVELSGSMNGKIVMHPEFARLRHARTEPAGDTPQKRILVVDDEKMLLILAGELLRGAGYAVVTAQSGFECLDMFRASPRRFDLVLLDLSMPLMDGEETFQRLRALRPEVRVMLCTGFVQQERLNHMLDSGLCGFIQKPLGPRGYLAAVRTALQQGAFATVNSSDVRCAAM